MAGSVGRERVNKRVAVKGIATGLGPYLSHKPFGTWGRDREARSPTTGITVRCAAFRALGGDGGAQSNWQLETRFGGKCGWGVNADGCRRLGWQFEELTQGRGAP